MESLHKTVWIVGQAIDSAYSSWNFQGVFETERDAVLACGDHENYFVGPALLGMPFPHETVPWKGAYYPNQVEA